MSEGMEMVLRRHKFDVKPEMVSSIHSLSCTCRAMFSGFLFLLCHSWYHLTFSFVLLCVLQTVYG